MDRDRDSPPGRARTRRAHPHHPWRLRRSRARPDRPDLRSRPVRSSITDPDLVGPHRRHDPRSWPRHGMLDLTEPIAGSSRNGTHSVFRPSFSCPRRLHRSPTRQRLARHHPRRDHPSLARRAPASFPSPGPSPTRSGAPPSPATWSGSSESPSQSSAAAPCSIPGPTPIRRTNRLPHRDPTGPQRSVERTQRVIRTSVTHCAFRRGRRSRGHQ